MRFNILPKFAFSLVEKGIFVSDQIKRKRTMKVPRVLRLILLLESRRETCAAGLLKSTPNKSSAFVCACFSARAYHFHSAGATRLKRLLPACTRGRDVPCAQQNCFIAQPPPRPEPSRFMVHQKFGYCFPLLFILVYATLL